jgi:AmiR/NasT family two-component response regulator
MAKKILIVEDDRMLLHLFKMFLKELGHEIIGFAQDSKQVIEKCEENMPDVILMDIHIKGKLNGIETAKIIHRKFDVPIVYITSDTNEETIQEAIYTNTYGFIVKPIYKTTLGIIIDLAFYKYKHDKELKIRERENYAAINVSQKPIILVSDRRIEYANLRGVEFLNANQISDILTKDISNFIDEEYLSRFENCLQESRKNNKELSFDSKIKTVSGELIDVNISCSIIESGHEKVTKLKLLKL